MNLKRTARATGLWYLALGLTGVFGFLLLDPMVFVAGDPDATLTKITDNAEVASLRVALELAIVASQAMAALYFAKLLKGINVVAGAAIMGFGLVNAAAILASAAFLGTAVAVAGDPSLAPGLDTASIVGLLQELSAQSWNVGGLFFGFWLIPMGWVALKQGRFPRILGYVLVVGGIGYILSSFVLVGLPDAASWVSDSLAMTATVGEFWMIGYLLSKGIRPDSHPAVTARLTAAA